MNNKNLKSLSEQEKSTQELSTSEKNEKNLDFSRRDFLRVGTIAGAAAVAGVADFSFIAEEAIAATPKSTGMSEASKLLTERGKGLERTIVKMSNSVYAALNYTVSAVTFIVGKNGIVLVDAGQIIADCEDALKDFRTQTKINKPIVGIIYTHGHPDHTMGTPAFLKNGNNDNKSVEIWARDNFNAENKQFAMLNPIFGERGSRQGGFLLPAEKRINNGIAPVRYPREGAFNSEAKPVLPTKTFAGAKQVVKIDDVELELYAAPGETEDQLFIWYPKEKILFSGDNMYRSFPNLYAIRGAGYRDVRSWINSIEDMMKFSPNGIVLGHNLPVQGAKESKEFMKNYHDAIKYVYDECIKGMNAGLTADELAESIKLPANLAKLDYLQEFYGNVEWSVKAIFVGHLGWFDGNARKLMPLTLKEEAENMAKLVGGNDALLKKAQQALKENNPKWAAQLADYCLTLDVQAITLPAKEVKIEALEILAETLKTATGRNYMFTQAQALRESLKSRANYTKFTTMLTK